MLNINFLPLVFRLIKAPIRAGFATYKKAFIFNILLAITLGFFSIFGPVLLVLGTLIGGWLMLKPFLAFCAYKTQGAKGYYKPFGGFFADRMNDAQKEGDFMKYFKKVVDEDPNTKFIASNIGSRIMLHLVDPELIKEFVNQPQLYKKAEFVSGIEGLFEGQGILFSEGERWKKQRKLLSACFNVELLKDQIPIMTKVAEEVYDQIGKNKDLSQVNIQKINQRVSGDIIGNMFFGSKYNNFSFGGESLTMGLRTLIKDGFKQMYTPWNALFGAWFIRAGILEQHRNLMTRIQDLRSQIQKIIKEVRKQSNTSSFDESCVLSTLLQQQVETPENSMSDDEIIDNFISLFLAGTDPTANLVSMSLYYLSQNAENYKRILSEIRETIKDGREVQFEDVQKLNYTFAVVKETLRKANPQAMLVFRESLQSHQLKNLKIKKGTLITFSPLLNGFNQRYFLDGEDFKPTRWLPEGEKDKVSELKTNPFAFVPFSAGPKACLGQNFATLEAKVMLSTLVKKFNFNLADDYDLKMANKATYEPIEDLKLSLTPV